MLSKANGAAETERLLKEAVLFLDETSILTDPWFLPACTYRICF
jgi:hypothetical protein